ncbi:hypothetical protein, partial [Planktothrix sp.]|uniref:hypothetical protein n=1 Tax=Planktothrix sp. TaxID=3088171 RepID=UPI0038D501E1
MTKRQRGRPSKLTPAIKSKLLSMIRIGVPLESACKCCNLDYSTVKEWIQRGKGTHSSRGKTPEFSAFADSYEQAIGECEANLIARIQQSASHDWKAAAWLLSRRHPQRWAEPKPTSLEDVIVSMAQSGLLSSEQLD